MDELVLEEVGGCGDTLTASQHTDGTIYFEIDNPWSGDTVSGVGRSSSFTLTKDQAKALAAKLLAWAGA